MNRLRTGIGHVSRAEVRPDREGRLGDAAIQYLGAVINAVIAVLNGGLRIGDGTNNSAAGNFDGLLLHVQFGAADTEVAYPHDLQRPPIGAVPLWSDRACRVYSLRGESLNWGSDRVAYFACDTADAKTILLLL